MGNLQYIKNRYQRKKQCYRVKLGCYQLQNYLLLNVIWFIIILGIYAFVHIRNNLLLNLDIPQLLEPVFCWSIIILSYIFPILLVLCILQGIGEMTARKDEADIYRVFCDRRDVKNEAPILIYKRKIKGKNITVREFYTTIPMGNWKQETQAIADIMNIRILGEIEYSNNNGNKVVIKSAKGRTAKERGTLYDDTF